MQGYELRAQYYETDQMGIIHHSNYIRWFESARIWYMHQVGADYREMEEMGILSPVLEVSCTYRSMLPGQGRPRMFPEKGVSGISRSL